MLVDNKLYVYGGFDNDYGVLSDFNMIDCTNFRGKDKNNEKSGWINLNVKGGPGPRHSHSSIYYQGSIYIFGGKVDRFKSTNSIYAYNIKLNKWSLVHPHEQTLAHAAKSIKS